MDSVENILGRTQPVLPSSLLASGHTPSSHPCPPPRVHCPTRSRKPTNVRAGPRSATLKHASTGRVAPKPLHAQNTLPPPGCARVRVPREPVSPLSTCTCPRTLVRTGPRVYHGVLTVLHRVLVLPSRRASSIRWQRRTATSDDIRIGRSPDVGTGRWRILGSA